MDDLVVSQNANEVPPRKSAVIALGVDTTARAYDITGLALGGYTPPGSNTAPKWTSVYLQADGGAVYVVFDSTNTVTLDDTAKIAAGGTMAFANTYGALIPSGASVKVRINRKDDKYLHIKTASGTAVLRMWASSEAA